jgi:hypothetical protein
MTENQRAIIEVGCEMMESRVGSLKLGPEFVEEFAAAIRAALAERDEAIADRDEARREYCEARADLLSKPTSPEVIAANRGWDCFAKEGR